MKRTAAGGVLIVLLLAGCGDHGDRGADGGHYDHGGANHDHHLSSRNQP